jgi:hypothetical protein
MNRLNMLIILGLIFTLFTSACAGASTSEMAAQVTPTFTETPTPLSSSTPTSTPTDVPIPTPTNTSIPLLTNTPSPLPTPTAAPTDIPAPPPPPTDSPTTTVIPAEPTSQPNGGQEADTAEPTPSSRTVRVGLHGRNDFSFEEADYQLIREANIETLKMMSLTDPAVFARIKQENPDIEFIVRLYDDRIGENSSHPTPQEFADRMMPIMHSLQPYVTKFEISNEPNHVHRYEGWGSEDADAEDFNKWFLEVYDLLKTAHPWAELGYPALATPNSYHRDRAWLEITREAIEKADWLGVHCYWQTYPDGTSTMFDQERGMCFKYYHELFPDKPLEMTEFDNDNVIWDIPPLSAEEIAQEYVTYYQELFKYPYLRSASSFIMSSPDSRWDYFAWRTQADGFKPVVTEMANMSRPPLVGE